MAKSVIDVLKEARRQEPKTNNELWLVLRGLVGDDINMLDDLLVMLDEIKFTPVDHLDRAIALAESERGKAGG